MDLWLAALLFIILACGVSALLFFASRKKSKVPLIAGACALGFITLVLAAYIALTFLFVRAVDVEMSPEVFEISEPAAHPSSSPIASREPSPTPSPTSSAMPDDFDLPVSEVPELYPDMLGLRDKEYGDMPVFATVNEASAYVLHNVLSNQFEMEFYLARELVPEVGSGYVLFCAFENAQSYFPFGAYDIWDAYTEDRGDPDKVFARLKLEYTGDENADMEARAEALEFVMKNPVPYDGFADFESEKAFALKIHDFIARKITYSPIGYNINAALSKDSYEMKQEAYNVLGEDQRDAVCAGYARAFAMICHYAGINATWVRGNETEDESHAWNVIYPRDGNAPVIVDVTWDDCNNDDIVGQEMVSDRYFYLPLHDDFEHVPVDYIEAFLRFENSQ